MAEQHRAPGRGAVSAKDNFCSFSGEPKHKCRCLICKLAAAEARIAELKAALREREEITRGDVAKVRELLDRNAELERRLRRRAARRKTDAWDGTGQPAPTQADPDGYQKG